MAFDTYNYIDKTIVKHRRRYLRAMGERLLPLDFDCAISTIDSKPISRKTIITPHAKEGAEVKCSFTRDYSLIKAELKNDTSWDMRCMKTGLRCVNELVLSEWGNNTPCQVILITDGNAGYETSTLPLPFSFPSKIHIICVTSPTPDNVRLTRAKPVYQKIIDMNRSEGSLLTPAHLDEPSISAMFEKLADDIFTSFKGTLNCGEFKSNILLLPAPIPYTKISDFEFETYTVSNALNVCGFISIADVGSPMAISRHLILPAPTAPKEKSVTAESEADAEASEDDKIPSFCVLFHGALKVENMAALVRLSDNWFGFIYSGTDSKKKFNLMLMVLLPGNDSVPWLGNLSTLHCGDGISADNVLSFPIRSAEKKSYSQNSVVWIRQSGLQSDIQKILRHAKKLPEKTQQFYKELNRVRAAAIKLGFLNLLNGLAAIFQQECTLLPGTAHPDCAIQLTHAAESLKKPHHYEIRNMINPLQTNY